ncbi:MAG: cytochrome P460 family protein [Planctomycetota bacterium]
MTRAGFGIFVTALVVLALALAGCKGMGGQDGCGAGCGCHAKAGCGGCGCGGMAGCGCGGMAGCGCGGKAGCGCGGKAGCGCGGCGGCGCGASMSSADKGRAMELFRAHKTWRKMNRTPVKSKPHGGMMIYDYVNSRGQPTFTAGRGTYLTGAAIAKVGLKGGRVAKVWLMEKRRRGYDRSNGDWWYAQLSAAGKVEKAGKLAKCINCHTNARNDYVYGLK